MASRYTEIVPPKAVCLLSGGLDSATCLAIARRDGFECFALSFDYGQRHRVELDAAARVASPNRVKRNAKGRPTQKLTQLLTPEDGKPALERLLEGVILLMRMSTDWSEFKIKLDEYYPRYGDTLLLPLEGGVYRLPSP